MQLAVVPPGAMGSMNEYSLSRYGKGFPALQSEVCEGTPALQSEVCEGTLPVSLRFVRAPHCWSISLSCTL